MSSSLVVGGIKVSGDPRPEDLKCPDHLARCVGDPFASTLSSELAQARRREGGEGFARDPTKRSVAAIAMSHEYERKVQIDSARAAPIIYRSFASVCIRAYKLEAKVFTFNIA